MAYAKQHKLTWHEDETNQDEAYMRNWVRKRVVPKLSNSQRIQLLDIQNNALDTNAIADELLDSMIDSSKPEQISKKLLLKLPHNVAFELIAHWLRVNGLKDIDSKMLERILLGAKTLKNGAIIDVNKLAVIEIEKASINLKVVE